MSQLGSFENIAAVRKAFEGAWVDADEFTVPETTEVFLGMRIFEEAKLNIMFTLPSQKDGDYNSMHKCEHHAL